MKEKKRQPLLAVFAVAILLLAAGLAISNVALVSGAYRRAIQEGFGLAVLADCLFAYVFMHGSPRWRIASVIGGLPSLYVLYDFLNRGL